jgi:hypothetical protein
LTVDLPNHLKRILSGAGRWLQIGEQINGIADDELFGATGWPDGEIAMAPAARAFRA